MKYSSSCKKPYRLLSASSAATNTAAMTHTRTGTRSEGRTGACRAAGVTLGTDASTTCSGLLRGDGGEHVQARRPAGGPAGGEQAEEGGEHQEHHQAGGRDDG